MYARFFSFEPETEVEAGFTLPSAVPGNGRVVRGELPAGEVALTLHVGPYDRLVAAADAVREWMQANGREPGGAPWEVYVSDPDEVPESEARTELYCPLKG